MMNSFGHNNTPGIRFAPNSPNWNDDH